MGLTSAFQIGQSALHASQIAIQVAGNNLANAATPGYSRQVALLSPARGDQSTPGVSIGTGVRVGAVRRQVSDALQARLWSGVAAESGAARQYQVLSQLESSLNELSGQDLSSELSAFFGVWSERANLTKSSAVVVQQGERLAQFMQRVRADIVNQRRQIDDQIASMVQRTDSLLTELAGLNSSISIAEGAGGGKANSLRDQRDILITELSQYVDLTAVEQASGNVDILIGSTPVLLAGRSRGVELRRETIDGELSVTVRLRDDGQALPIRNGEIGALLASRDATIQDTIGRLDNLASQLIFEVNRLHSTGTNAAGLTTTIGTRTLPAADRTLALNDPENKTLSAMPFRATNGGFLLRVKQSTTGAEQEVFVKVDLDGRTSSGLPGFADDTSADDIRAAINAVDGVSATFTADGKLSITADAGFEFSFGDDTSGALALLGVNSYFQGTDASDIGVRSVLKSDATLLMTGRREGGTFIENGTALGVVALQERSLQALGNQSITSNWIDSVQRVGVATQTSNIAAQSSALVRQSLETQRSSISGVSIDEESIDLMTYQRQYQGAARFISIVDELTQILISLA